MRRLDTLTRGAFVVVLFTVGCARSPVSPMAVSAPVVSASRGNPTPTAPVPPVPTNLSSASLAIEDAYALVYPDGPRFVYGIRFLLRETKGASGATVEGVDVYGPEGVDLARPSCWGDTLRVPAGGQLDTFYTDAGANWLSYCGPGSGGPTVSPSLYVIVNFRDDQGVGGSVGAPITRIR